VQVQRRAPEEDFHPAQYAAKIMEEIEMPHTMANMRAVENMHVVAAAVTAEAKAGRTMSEAYLWLEQKSVGKTRSENPLKQTGTGVAESTS